MAIKHKASAITFGGINENNIEQLRLLNDVTFPVRYTDKFYKEILTLLPEFSKYAYSSGFVVGAICCRLEAGEGGKRKLYIMTLGVLAAYRGNMIGSRLLTSVLEVLSKHDNVEEIYLHVQTNNQDALDFYAKHQFEKGEIIRDYYKLIKPPDCFVLRRRLRDNSQHQAQS